MKDKIIIGFIRWLVFYGFSWAISSDAWSIIRGQTPNRVESIICYFFTSLVLCYIGYKYIRIPEDRR